MYKYIFCDLDGTLLDDVKKIPEVNIEAIKMAENAGVTFMFSTGRVPFCFEEYGKDIDISSYSACNGAIISYKGKIIKDRYMDKNIAERLLEYGVEHKISERIFTKDRLYLTDTNLLRKIILRYAGARDISHNEAKKLIKEEKIYKICYCLENRKVLEKAKDDLLKENLGLEAFFSAPTFLEFGNLGENKGQGIRDFCTLTHENIEETIAIGDNENDLSMIETAGIGACPSNSIPAIKEKADYIAQKDNNHGAVAEVIDHYIFNK